MNEYSDGIYFGMSDDDYFAIPALSSTGIKNILVSPLDFWARSWMNPNKKDENTFSKTLGKAFHTRILEGKAAFYSRFAEEFVIPDNALLTSDDLRSALRSNGLKTSGNKDELIVRLLAYDPLACIADDIKSIYEEEHKGKTLLPSDIISDIELNAAMIEKNPVLNRCFRGGYPEVVVLWTETWWGKPVRLKAKIDYLKTKAIVDYKTFSNQRQRPIDSAVMTAMASYKYHIQATLYLRAAEHAKGLAVYGDVAEDWLNGFRECPEHEFFFVFQQIGTAPLARGYKFPKTMMHGVGSTQIEAAIMRYQENLERFGTDPWVDMSDFTQLEDGNFPQYATEL